MSRLRFPIPIFRFLPVVAVVVAGSILAPRTASAVTVNDILDVMVDYQIVDPAIRDAHEMLDCLVANNGDPGPCFNIPTEAEKQAGAAAARFMPDDPKIKAVVDLVLAVKRQRWLTVIELAGIDIMLPMLCDIGTSAAGPVGKWVCQGPFRQTVTDGLAEEIAREVIVVLTSDDHAVEKYFKLVALLGDVELACNLIPDEVFPAKTEVCGFLGKIIAEIGGALVDSAKYGAKLVVAAGDEVENVIFGSDAHMSYDRYYGLYWLPWLHKSVDLCITRGCQGTGALNERIWNDCVDYFDSHNQYRSTAKKTCDDMRDKRYHKTYQLMADAVATGAKSYALSLRAGARAWAITEYGKNNDQGIRENFRTLCETELEKGYPLSSGSPKVCDAYKRYDSPLIRAMYEPCMEQVARQRVVPTAWRNACKKAEPDFVSVLQGERNALQAGITDLVAQGCHPPAGWNAGQGLRFRCDTYSGFDQCKTLMVVSAGSICSVDRARADAARAREIHTYLGSNRCSLDGTEIRCTRPWKRAQCQQLVTKTRGIQLSKTALSCSEDSSGYYEIAFANQALIEELNRPVARGGQGAACTWIEDKAKIKCLRTDRLKAMIAAKAELGRPACGADPNYDGADASCYLVPFDLNSAPTPIAMTVGDSPAVAGNPIALATPPSGQAARIRDPRLMDAPPNPCHYEARYYVPQPPVVETSSSDYQVGDQVQIRCEFSKKTHKLEWAQCSDAAQSAIRALKFSQESGSRYSGISIIDGTKIDVTTSPADGSDFTGTALWSFREPGVHKVTCAVDNGLRPAQKDGSVYLESSVEVDIGGTASERQFRRYDPNAVRQMPAKPIRREPGQ